ncbi:MAG: carboxypeptidase M32, partial [Chloroflexi bacterium]|nr:carboxypeptidase M32 [Chloroflexota bacterium]
MTSSQQAYGELKKLSKELTLVHSIDSVLNWERETTMPPNGEALRADQSAYLSGQYHRLLTRPR